MQKKKLSPERRAEVRALYAGGMTLKALAKKFGCHMTTVWRCVDARRPTQLAALTVEVKRLKRENEDLRSALEVAVAGVG